MKRNLLLVLYLYAIAIIQVSFLPNFFNSKNIPSLALVFIIFFAIDSGFIKALYASILLGVFIDFFYFYPIGLSALSLILASALTSLLSKKLFFIHKSWKLLILILIVFLGTFFYDFVFWIFLKAFETIKKTSVSNYHLADFVSLKKMIINSVIFSIIYFFLTKAKSLFLFQIRRESFKLKI